MFSLDANGDLAEVVQEAVVSCPSQGQAGGELVCALKLLPLFSCSDSAGVTFSLHSHRPRSMHCPDRERGWAVGLVKSRPRVSASEDGSRGVALSYDLHVWCLSSVDQGF